MNKKIFVIISVLILVLTSFVNVVNASDTFSVISTKNPAKFSKPIRLSNGTLIDVFIDYGGATDDLYYSWSTNEGASWGDDILLYSVGGDIQYWFDCAVDSNDVVWCSYYVADNKSINVLKFDDGTTTWSTNWIPSGIADSTDNCIVVDNDDYVHLGYNYRDATTYYYMYVMYNPVLGTWGTPITVDTFSGANMDDIAVTVDDLDNIYVFNFDFTASYYYLRSSYKTRSAGSWTTSVHYECERHGNINQMTAITDVDNNYVYVAYDDYTNASGEWDVDLVQFDSSCSYQKTIDVTSENATYDTRFCDIQLDGNNDVDVLYYGDRIGHSNTLIMSRTYDVSGDTLSDEGYVSTLSDDHRHAEYMYALYPSSMNVQSGHAVAFLNYTDTVLCFAYTDNLVYLSEGEGESESGFPTEPTNNSMCRDVHEYVPAGQFSTCFYNNDYNDMLQDDWDIVFQGTIQTVDLYVGSPQINLVSNDLADYHMCINGGNVHVADAILNNGANYIIRWSNINQPVDNVPLTYSFLCWANVTDSGGNVFNWWSVGITQLGSYTYGGVYHSFVNQIPQSCTDTDGDLAVCIYYEYDAQEFDNCYSDDVIYLSMNNLVTYEDALLIHYNLESRYNTYTRMWHNGTQYTNTSDGNDWSGSGIQLTLCDTYLVFTPNNDDIGSWIVSVERGSGTNQTLAYFNVTGLTDPSAYNGLIWGSPFVLKPNEQIRIYWYYNASWFNGQNATVGWTTTPYFPSADDVDREFHVLKANIKGNNLGGQTYAPFNDYGTYYLWLCTDVNTSRGYDPVDNFEVQVPKTLYVNEIWMTQDVYYLVYDDFHRYPVATPNVRGSHSFFVFEDVYLRCQGLNLMHGDVSNSNNINYEFYAYEDGNFLVELCHKQNNVVTVLDNATFTVSWMSGDLNHDGILDAGEQGVDVPVDINLPLLFDMLIPEVYQYVFALVIVIFCFLLVAMVEKKLDIEMPSFIYLIAGIGGFVFCVLAELLDFWMTVIFTFTFISLTVWYLFGHFGILRSPLRKVENGNGGVKISMPKIGKDKEKAKKK